MTLVIVLIIALILYVILAYNTMVKMRNQVKEAWSDIDVQLKRRYNLIPNIVESVKGYATHEEGVFTKVTEARANAINATNVKDQGMAENMLSGALKSLFAVAESYPDLKANENFLQLQNELVDTEDKIQSARRFYNGIVRDFNTKIQQFPAKIIANMFKFMSETFFEVENEEEKKNVEVSFKDEPKAEAAVEEKEEAPAPEAPAEEEKPAEAPAPVAEEAPAEAEKPVETPIEAPAPEVPAEEEKPAEEPVAPVEEEKVEETTEAPTEEEKTEEKPAEEPAPEVPAEEEKKEEE